MGYMYKFSKTGRSYKEFYSQKWVSEKPERFMVGFDIHGNEIYVGDKVRVFGMTTSAHYDYQPFYKVIDEPAYSDYVSLLTHHGGWPFYVRELEVIEH